MLHDQAPRFQDVLARGCPIVHCKVDPNFSVAYGAAPYASALPVAPFPAPGEAGEVPKRALVGSLSRTGKGEPKAPPNLAPPKAAPVLGNAWRAPFEPSAAVNEDPIPGTPKAKALAAVDVDIDAHACDVAPRPNGEPSPAEVLAPANETVVPKLKPPPALVDAGADPTPPPVAVPGAQL